MIGLIAIDELVSNAFKTLCVSLVPVIFSCFVEAVFSSDL